MIVGDFNRGKSTILNVLLGQELMSMRVTATTAIPIFVKYGEEEKVLVHKKDGSTEELSLEQYKQRYSLNSKVVQNQIKYYYKSVEKWLNNPNFAELHYPIELLLEGIEFIDTPGLNYTEEGNQKIFSYIQQSHAIIFVLAADQPFTHNEKEYLHNLVSHPNQIKKPIFYLINKWDKLGEEDKEEIRDFLMEEFCQYLDINENEAEKMWGDTVFNVYAKKALDNLKQGKNLDGTGLKEFSQRLDNFILNERLKTELCQALQMAKFVKIQVESKVRERLFILKQTEVEYEAEAKYLQDLVTNISTQVEIIAGKYNEIINDLG
ncbi:MAG: hypothetical protein F6K14_11180 [Symploca sp. SIO2C1]|nr:hypothetical protein [Symploca sp. SIO2C1]